MNNHRTALQTMMDKVDVLEREVTRSVESRLREEIRRKEISYAKLAELTGYLPVGAERLMSRPMGYWSLRECLLITEALGLKLHFVLKEVGTTSSRLMAE